MLDKNDLESRVSQIESDMGIMQHNLMQVMNWIKEHIRHAETLASKTEADRRFIRSTIDD